MPDYSPLANSTPPCLRLTSTAAIALHDFRTGQNMQDPDGLVAAVNLQPFGWL
jgi:hypothetical protein